MQPLSYAYNKQFPQSRNTLPYSLALGRHKPETYPMYATLYSIDASTISDPQQKRRQIKVPLPTFRTDVYTHIWMGQVKYVFDFDRGACNTSSFLADSYVFVRKRSSATTAGPCADTLARTTNYKPHQQTSGPYRIFEVRTSTVIVN